MAISFDKLNKWILIDTTDTTGLFIYNLTDQPVQLYPNPAKENVKVLLSNNTSIDQIIVINEMGQIMDAEIEILGSIAQIDLTSIPSGMYFVKVVENTEQHIMRLILE